jgi:hypothetical protein
VAVVRLFPARALAVEGDGLVAGAVLAVDGFQLRRWRRDAVLVLVGHELGSHAEEKEQHGKVEERVGTADEPEGNEQAEKVLHDELEGGEVEDEQDEDGGGGAVQDVGRGVLEGEAQATLAVADRCKKALKRETIIKKTVKNLNYFEKLPLQQFKFEKTVKIKI